MLTLLVAHLQFAQTNRTTQKLQKSHQSNATQSEYTKHNEKKGGRIIAKFSLRAKHEQ